MTTYVTSCCDGTVAEIEVNGDHVTISPPAGEELYRLQAPRRVEKTPNLSEEQMQLEYQARAKIHTVMMERVEVAERHVSEVIWAHHSSWIIRCLACREQLEVTQAKLRNLAHILKSGNWSVTGGVVPLSVLNHTR